MAHWPPSHWMVDCNSFHLHYIVAHWPPSHFLTVCFQQLPSSSLQLHRPSQLQLVDHQPTEFLHRDSAFCKCITVHRVTLHNDFVDRPRVPHVHGHFCVMANQTCEADKNTLSSSRLGTKAPVTLMNTSTSKCNVMCNVISQLASW